VLTLDDVMKRNFDRQFRNRPVLYYVMLLVHCVTWPFRNDVTLGGNDRKSPHPD